MGNRLCATHCVRVVSLTEDRGQALPARRDDAVFYLRGVRVAGLLQRDVVRARADRKRSAMPPGTSAAPSADAVEIRSDGVPVILEVTSACMATTSSVGATLSASPTSTPRRVSVVSGQHEAVSAEIPPQPATAFVCPVYRSIGQTSSALLETELCVMTTQAHAALVLSGAGLLIDSVHVE